MGSEYAELVTKERVNKSKLGEAGQHVLRLFLKLLILIILLTVFFKFRNL